MITLEKKYELVTEGLFAIPRNSFQNIFNYVAEIYKYVNSGQRISPHRLKPKILPISLAGTNFEFLEKFHPQVKVFFYRSANTEGAKFWTYDKEIGEVSDKWGNIYINLNGDLQDILTTVLEHEILHYIQHLIRSHRDQSDDYIGGLPSKKVIPNNLTTHGYVKGKEKKRVKHSRRPIEYYTNLNSAVREVQKFYNTSKSVHRFEDSPKERKRFFVGLLEKLKNGKLSGRFADTFADVKKENPELYKAYLRLTYNAFVNGKNDINHEEIDNAVESSDKSR